MDLEVCFTNQDKQNLTQVTYSTPSMSVSKSGATFLLGAKNWVLLKMWIGINNFFVVIH